MATLFTRIHAYAGTTNVPATFTTLTDGRVVGEFLPALSQYDRPYELRDTYEGDLGTLLTAMAHAVDTATGYAECVGCGHYAYGEHYTDEGVTEWLCYPCGQGNGGPHIAGGDCDCGLCFCGSSALDDDAAWLASAGWGTDEDY